MKRAALIGLVLVTVLGVAGYLGGGRLLARRIEAAVQKTCDACEIGVGHARVRGAAVVVENVVFTYGAEDVRHRYRAVLAGARITPVWRDLLLGRPHIAEVVLDGLQVTMIDHAEGRGHSAGTHSDRPSSVMVDRVHVNDAGFTYVRDRKNTHAVVAFRRLHGDVEVAGEDVHARLTGQLGFSGEMRLDLKAAPGPRADLELWFNDQNLADLGAFFEPNAGVRLAGALHFAHATSRLRGTGLATRVRAVFDDFDLEVAPDADRDGWTAFFTNLGISIGLKQSNVDLKEGDQTRAVDLERRPREGLVAFILRGIKDAVFSVAKKPVARALTE